MAGWWMPVKQLAVLRRMEAGEALVRVNRTGRYYLGEEGDCVTAQAKALLRKAYVCEGVTGTRETGMFITATGKNEMGYNRHREID